MKLKKYTKFRLKIIQNPGLCETAIFFLQNHCFVATHCCNKYILQLSIINCNKKNFCIDVLKKREVLHDHFISFLPKFHYIMILYFSGICYISYFFLIRCTYISMNRTNTIWRECKDIFDEKKRLCNSLSPSSFSLPLSFSLSKTLIKKHFFYL